MKIRNLLLALLFVASPALATTWPAASCSQADISTALGHISADGDVVTVPAGNCSWTTALTYNQVFSFTLQGAGAIDNTGAGSDQTIIEDDYTYTSGSGFFNIVVAAGKSFRMTGIAFYWSASQTSLTNNGEIQINGPNSNVNSVRIDHCHFLQPSNATNGIVIMSIWNWIYGVADHNKVDLYSADSNWVRVGMPSYGGDTSGTGNLSWMDPANFGTGNFFFLETNTISWLGPTSNPGSDFAATNDCNAGGRMVVRYNQINGLLLTQMHEQEGDLRGCRAFEFYMNNLSGDTTNPFATGFGTRMGASVVWGNTVVGFKNVGQATNDRTNNGHSFPAPPAGWGYCGTALGPSAWDENTNSFGYPCIDQVGRGAGQLITGYFPSKINSITGIVSWPNNAPEPVYVFANNYTAPTGGGGGNAYFVSNDPNTIAERRDYYLQIPNFSEPSPAVFDGTNGVGMGTLAPTASGAYSGAPSCMTLVGYWNTATQSLWKCTATNTWTSYYSPYAYPNPLVTSSVANPSISPSAGPRTSPQTITITDATSGATICFRTDGVTPTTNGAGVCGAGSTTYSGPFSQAIPATIEAVGTKSGLSDSGVVSTAYTLGRIIQANGAAGASVPFIVNVTSGNYLYAFAYCSSSASCSASFTSTHEAGLWSASIYSPLTTAGARLALSCVEAAGTQADSVSAIGDGSSINIPRMQIYEANGSSCTLDSTSPSGGFVISDSTQTSPVASSSIATTTGNDLVFMFAGNGANSVGTDAWTAGSGFSNLTCVDNTAYNSACSTTSPGLRIGVEALTQVSAGTVSASFTSTLAASKEWATLLAAFRPASPALPTPQNLSIILLGP